MGEGGSLPRARRGGGGGAQGISAHVSLPRMGREKADGDRKVTTILGAKAVERNLDARDLASGTCLTYVPATEQPGVSSAWAPALAATKLSVSAPAESCRTQTAATAASQTHHGAPTQQPHFFSCAHLAKPLKWRALARAVAPPATFTPPPSVVQASRREHRDSASPNFLRRMKPDAWLRRAPHIISTAALSAPGKGASSECMLGSRL